MQGKSVLVTGATGFVGSHILEALMDETDIPLITACRDRSRLLPAFNGEVREGDMRDPGYLSKLFKGVDVVCNGFAWTSAWGHVKQSSELLLKPSTAMIDAARSAGVRRFINNSSTSCASPDRSGDPDSTGIKRALWPHLDNVVEIENYLRQQSDDSFQVINLRLGLFAGRRYGLGLLPMLLPRLKTHLVPWINGGTTSMPIIDGRDIGQAFTRAVLTPGLGAYEGFNIVGPEVPTASEVINFLHDEWGYPTPHFSVPFFIAYPFARVMEWLDPIVPWEPLVTRSIVHLQEEVNADNRKAEELLNYAPRHHWQTAISEQILDMQKHPKRFKNMAVSTR